MSIARILLLDDLEVAGGEALHVIPQLDGRMTDVLDRRQELNFPALRYLRGEPAPWFEAALLRRHVVRVEIPEYEITRQWRLSGLEDSLGDSNEMQVMVKAEPAITLFRDVGFLRATTIGGGSQYILEDELSEEDWIANYIIPFMTDYGHSYVSIGDIEFSGLHPIKIDRWTPLQLLNELESRSGGELYFNDADGTINLVEQIGEAEPQVLISGGRNVLSLRRTRAPTGYATVIQPFGKIPKGETERATIAFAAWPVTAVSGDVLTLSPSPIVLDDQYVLPTQRYALAPDGTLWAIESTTAATGQMTLETGGGAHFTANVSRLEIRADDQGTLLDELEDPTATKRVVGSFDVAEARGERNYQPNPFGEGADTDGIWGQVDADVSGSATVTIKSISPSNRPFPDNAVLIIASAPSIGYLLSHTFYQITNPETASGGVVTFDVSPNITATEDTTVLIVDRETLPTGWTDPNAATNKAAIWFTRPTDLPNLTGLVNGAYNTSTGRLTMDGLSSDDDIYPGDVVKVGNIRYLITLPAAVSGGAATVHLTYLEAFFPPNATTLADNVAIEIIRPNFQQDVPATSAITVFSRALNPGGSGSAAGVLDLPPITIPYVPGKPTLAIRIGMVLRGGSNALNIFDLIDVPVVQLLDDDTDAVLAQVIVTAQATAETDINEPVRMDYTMDQTRTFRLRLIGPGRRGQNAGVTTVMSPIINWHYATLFLGSSDPEIPIIEDSHANVLVDYGNVRLLVHGQIPEEWKASHRDLVHRFNMTPPEAKPVMGAEARYHIDEIDLDEIFRFVRVDYGLVGQEPEYILATKLDGIFQALDKRFSKRGGSGAGSIAIGRMTEAREIWHRKQQEDGSVRVIRVEERSDNVDEGLEDALFDPNAPVEGENIIPGLVLSQTSLRSSGDGGPLNEADEALYWVYTPKSRFVVDTVVFYTGAFTPSGAANIQFKVWFDDFFNNPGELVFESDLINANSASNIYGLTEVGLELLRGVKYHFGFRRDDSNAWDWWPQFWETGSAWSSLGGSTTSPQPKGAKFYSDEDGSNPFAGVHDVLESALSPVRVPALILQSST